MKKHLISAILAVAAMSASAQELTTKVTCVSLESAIKVFTTEYKEQVHWSGSASSTEYLLFVNKNTRTWSMGFTDGKRFCILGDGKNFVDVGSTKQ